MHSYGAIREMRYLIIILLMLGYDGSLYCQSIGETGKHNVYLVLSDYNVAWDSPSENSLGSMPAGNGDIGINLWAEKNGDLLFYLSKTDAWSENARLLKIGKVRLSLSPNPFVDEKPFLQQLILSDGIIHIEAGDKGKSVSIDVWVDANYPVVQLDVKSEQPVTAKISTEPWRTQRRKIAGDELHSAYGLHGAGAKDVFIEKDTILSEANGEVVWLHRNERSIWQDNLKLQLLDSYIDENKDPLLHRTFGGLIRSKELTKANPSALATSVPLKQFSAMVYVLTAQTGSIEKWEKLIVEKALVTEAKSIKNRIYENT
jgi:hypothetical protein